MNKAYFASLNWADYFIIAVLVLSTLLSLIRGFVREAISLVTWVLAIWVGLKFSPMLAAVMQDMIQTPSVRVVVSFLLLFISVLLIGGLINFLISQLVTKTGLSSTNRLAGSIFGFARGVLTVGLLVLLARHTALPNDPWWKEAKLLAKFEPVADKISVMLPDKVHKMSHLLLEDV